MPETLTLRPATLNDMAAVETVLAASYPRLLKADYPASVLVTAIPLLSRAQPQLLASGTYYVVEDEESAIVGAGGWTRRGPPNVSALSRGLGHIRHVVTDHRKTRRGVGRRLMSHIFAEARLAGVTELECQSTLTARPFYASCGFEEIRPILVPLRPGIDFPAVLMRRRLDKVD